MVSRSSSSGGFLSITKDIDFPLPVVPTRNTLVMFFFGETSFHFFFIDFCGTTSPYKISECV